ncbi:MAG: hypothetical protein QM758_06595 [Armatimonas sp.]
MWAQDMWMSLLTYRSDQITTPWIARFALRSQAALIGIQITTPDNIDRDALYQRIYVRFIQETLHPFVDWVKTMQSGDARYNAYKPVIALYCACEGFTGPADAAEWRRLHQRLSNLARAEGFEAFKAWQLAESLLNGIIVRLNLEKAMPSSFVFFWKPFTVLYPLNRQHQWRLDGQEGKTPLDGSYSIELIADAFLVALEAKCPPPDWLPQT